MKMKQKKKKEINVNEIQCLSNSNNKYHNTQFHG